MSSIGVAGGLRRWAKGSLDQEAGVELLIRACGGRFAQQGCPWIRECDRPGWSWVDVTELVEHLSVFSGGERRVLSIVAALIDRRPVFDLVGVLCGMDRPDLHLVLAALAHAAGSHHQVELLGQGDQLTLSPLPALLEWPAEQEHAA